MSWQKNISYVLIGNLAIFAFLDLVKIFKAHCFCLLDIGSFVTALWCNSEIKFFSHAVNVENLSKIISLKRLKKSCSSVFIDPFTIN